MAIMDRFGGAEAWDAHCEREDAMRENAVCADCKSCNMPPEGEWCWCEEFREWTRRGDKVAELGCDSFGRR